MIGVVGGALGVILGTLRMPALLGAVGLDARRAVGTNLVVGFFLGVRASPRTPSGSRSTGACSASASRERFRGAWFGARITGRIPELQLRRAIGVALLVIAALSRSRRSSASDVVDEPVGWRSVLARARDTRVRYYASRSPPYNWAA